MIFHEICSSAWIKSLTILVECDFHWNHKLFFILNYIAWWKMQEWTNKIDSVQFLIISPLYIFTSFLSAFARIIILSISLYELLSLIKDHAETKPMKSIVADICDTESIEDVFNNVDVVFHCAALINFQFPPNINELERVNVNGKFNDWHLSSTSVVFIFIVFYFSFIMVCCFKYK